MGLSNKALLKLRGNLPDPLVTKKWWVIQKARYFI